jgi:expansin (peptidoglycan-binding protein)
MPETVMVTYHAKAGSEAALASVIARQWAWAIKLKLVLETPHTLVRGNEQGKTYFVEFSLGETPIFLTPLRQPYKTLGRK